MVQDKVIPSKTLRGVVQTVADIQSNMPELPTSQAVTANASKVLSCDAGPNCSPEAPLPVNTNDVLISIENLSKHFKIYERPTDRLREWFSAGRIVRHRKFSALKNFSLKVRRGECIGLIGPNGAGKSTLLKIISGALVPSSGSYQTSGRMLSLLELGTGFNAELTGRQNVIETARLLGMPSGYAEDHMKTIEEFAKLNEFFDRPIKIYSSGMYVRLAFSMFIAMQPDILIVDEALAVGDIGFQRKCFRAMEDMIKTSERAVILVSHDTTALTKFCSRVLWLDQGEIRMSGDPVQVIEAYTKHMLSGEAAPKAENERSTTSNEAHSAIPIGRSLKRGEAAVVYPNAGAELLGVWLEDKNGSITQVARVNESFKICYAIRFLEKTACPVFGIRLVSVHGNTLTGVNTQLHDLATQNYDKSQVTVVRWPVAPGLAVGDYFLSCGCSRDDNPLEFLMREVDAYTVCIRGISNAHGLVTLVGRPQIQNPL